MKKFLVVFFVLAFACLQLCFAESIDELDINSRSVYMVNLNNGQVMLDKNSGNKMEPASLTKIMTTLVVLENCKDIENEKVYVDDESLFYEIRREGGANLALTAGETFTVKDLLYATMLYSACDAAELPFHGDFIFEIPQEYRARLHTDRLVVREFSHEKDFAPKGKALLQTLTLCGEEDARAFIQLRADKKAYAEKKRCIATDVVEIITRKFPSLAGRLKALDVWTPATYQRYIGSEIGSWMSFILPPRRSPRTLDNRAKPLKNVVFATQWLRAPGGLPIAASEGKRAIDRVLKMIPKAKTV